MEIDPLLFLTQEDFSHFYDYLNEDEPLEGQNKQNNNDNNIKNLLASLILLEQEENTEQQNHLVESLQHKSIINSNFNHQSQTTNHYMEQFQHHHTQFDKQFHHTRTKKSRLYAFAAASVISGSVKPGSDQPGSDQPGSINIENNQPRQQHPRRLWMKDRSKDWWENCNRGDFPEEEFRRNFRMSKSTFNMICNELDSSVTKKNTMLRDAIPVRQRVGVCIYRLATGEPLRLVSKKFGLGISTCHKLVLEVCSAIKTVLMPKFIRWFNRETLKKTKKEFEGMFGIPNIGGALYTTHVPIIAPKGNVAMYLNKKHTERNQKTSYSITVQGVVNSKGVFTDVSIGWPGSMCNNHVLEKSALYKRANRGNLKDVWIVGNSGYPLMDWILVPYTHKNLTWTQHFFNEKIGEIENVGKEAFGRLKGRWGCLQKRTEIKLMDLPVVIGACCVLHNICEIMNEEMDYEWKFEVFDDEMVVDSCVRSVNSMLARDQIAHSLFHHGRSTTTFL
uniref:Protein ALP1-like n=1 Tax=Cicer arietinum TaxID=3827 RepID=A0A1S2Z1R6_CICAR|nr:protein ALP1-like [Cicer arietinum]